MSTLFNRRKSSFSGAQDPDCVEFARGASAVLLRESDAPCTILTSTPPASPPSSSASRRAGGLDHLIP
ncbi:DUF397 domain-containing protein [Streptomyces luomodiensis]|uniref:DUF397 domain-containing protein n=1 Tax=Streptomyces luomodiensis TaxID=3026192 RepID=A0ABY9UVV9_9ACTN|nr:DUF397 domain-containing protein [Streptomyces sp. SCA4-21]WNE96694.1 DUF397 domain-containing protein [Streptomyces sp. SCA4-21]